MTQARRFRQALRTRVRVAGRIVFSLAARHSASAFARSRCSGFGITLALDLSGLDGFLASGCCNISRRGAVTPRRGTVRRRRAPVARSPAGRAGIRLDYLRTGYGKRMSRFLVQLSPTCGREAMSDVPTRGSNRWSVQRAAGGLDRDADLGSWGTLVPRTWSTRPSPLGRNKPAGCAPESSMNHNWETRSRSSGGRP